MIEILNGVQATTLPIGSEDETLGARVRNLWTEWQATTECGTFIMRASLIYMFPIEHPEYLIPRSNVLIKITIVKIN
jgi:hypothetical protein